MPTPRNTSARTLIAAASIFLSTPLWADAVYFFGKIGDFPVAGSLERNQDELSGWYFYQSRAKQIDLEGKLDPKGTFRLEETADGKITGIFEGSVSQGHWKGNWRKAAGESPLPFDFEENHDQLQNLTGSFTCSTKERDTQFEYTHQSNLKLAVEKGDIKKFKADASSTSKSDEQACSLSLEDLEQVESKAGLELQAEAYEGGEEEPKCTVRIVGNQDFLLVEFGDISEPGNHCHGAASTLFCSTRGTWPSIVLDRRTQRCKTLK